MTASTNLLLGGALAALAFVAGVFFFKYWAATRDHLFLCFAAAFWLMGVNWAVASTLGAAHEARPYVYLLRLAAFALIAFGIIDKNRKRE